MRPYDLVSVPRACVSGTGGCAGAGGIVGAVSWGSEWSSDYTFLLDGAVDFAYANQALPVFARGNNGNIGTPVLPYEPQESTPEQRMLSVGAFEAGSGGTCAYWSCKGNGMDILGPSTDAANEYPWVYTTQYNTEIPGFAGAGTSFACPHATGVAALLSDYLYNNVIYKNPTPEDLQNIIKVTAYKPDGSGVSYDGSPNNWGWGDLNASNVFTKIDPSLGGYKLVSADLVNGLKMTPESDPDPRVSYGAWSAPSAMFFDYIGNNDETNSFAPGFYPDGCEDRKITVTISDKPGDWLSGWGIDWSYPVYVWGDGRPGAEYDAFHLGGYGPEEPYNAQVMTTICTNATGSSDPNMPGLIVPPVLGSTPNIVLATWQWRLLDPSAGPEPPDINLAWNFSLLFRPLVVAGVNNTSNNSQTSITCYPNPAVGYTRLQGIAPDDVTDVSIFNSIGDQMRSEDRESMTNSPLLIGTNNLPSGIYLVVVETTHGAEETKLVVEH